MSNEDKGLLPGWQFKIFDLNAKLLDIPKLIAEIQLHLNSKDLDSFKIDYVMPFYIILWWFENPIREGGISKQSG